MHFNNILEVSIISDKLNIHPKPETGINSRNIKTYFFHDQFPI